MVSFVPAAVSMAKLPFANSRRSLIPSRPCPFEKAVFFALKAAVIFYRNDNLFPKLLNGDAAYFGAAVFHDIGDGFFNAHADDVFVQQRDMFGRFFLHTQIQFLPLQEFAEHC